ncbi:MAG TPA: AAA domain-containing protein, partial [Solirubrobacterales bacterium]|nr:AAA domain-containing protein [Solirubrobacterales bacterium]
MDSQEKQRVNGVEREIVEFWRVVEMFSPPATPAVRASRKVFDAFEEPLPWHSLRREELKNHQTWRHIVYVGTYPREAVFEALEPIFPAVAGSFKERTSDDGALLAFAVADDGTMIEGSSVLSTCAWATARALDPGPESPGWLDGFAELQEQVASRLEESCLGDEDDTGKILDQSALEECRELVIDALGVSEVLRAAGIRISSEIVGRQAAHAVEHDFLNSFIVDDLARVAAAVDRDDVGQALRDYLRPTAELDTDARVDVRTRLDEVRRATDPDRVPLGRWPTNPDRPLALGQQLAVNEAVAMPSAGGHLFAVNGPPGTGKTTMLRDLIAALVTERAKQLAALGHPLDAFVGQPHRWQTSRFQRVAHRLRPELTGFEVVVASSNNGAVENVTLEIPSAEAIDEQWRGQAERVDYFPMLAERATNGQAAWALAAARLGNLGNRRAFVNAVWWTEDESPDKGGPPPPTGLRDLLSEWEMCPEGPSWTEAVAAFRSAHNREASIRDDRRRVREELDRLPELESKLATAREVEAATREEVEALRPRRDELAVALPTREEERKRRIEAREEEQRRRPCVLRFRARAAWQDRCQRLVAEIAALDTRLDEIGEELRAIEAKVRIHAEAVEVLAGAESTVDDCFKVLSCYRERPGAQLPDEEWHADRNRQMRERQAPWTDDEWNHARTELFLAALGLHRAFLVHAARPMRESLAAAMDIVAGNAPPGLPAEKALAAWQALFLLVPVVSTTFASVPRLFESLGAESLGWLLVDEAGQATPQNAVGALWRCQRGVIVGDPLQLEPIVTIPFAVEEGIRVHYGVDEEWLTRRGSVQSLADRLNRFGTTLRGSGWPVWVGAPLTVHRRCDQPMFDLSNKIAYDGLMIDATDPKLAEAFAADYPTLRESMWIDVPSLNPRGHWIPAEGAEVGRILAELHGLAFDFGQVMAIGPFRDVAQGLQRKRVREYSGLRAGTIHTAQGKEADIVILVLGS